MDSLDVTWLWQSFAAVLLAVSVNAAAAHLAFVGHAVARFTAVAALVGLGLTGYLAQRNDPTIEILAGVLTYAFLCELYVFLFTLAMASVSANVIHRLALGPLDENGLNRIYDSKTMVELRIARLLDKQLLVEEEDIRITDQGRRLAVAFNLLRRLLGRI